MKRPLLLGVALLVSAPALADPRVLVSVSTDHPTYRAGQAAVITVTATTEFQGEPALIWDLQGTFPTDLTSNAVSFTRQGTTLNWQFTTPPLNQAQDNNLTVRLYLVDRLLANEMDAVIQAKKGVPASLEQRVLDSEVASSALLVKQQSRTLAATTTRHLDVIP